MADPQPQTYPPVAASANGDAAASEPRSVSTWLTGHLGCDCLTLSVVEQKFAQHEHVNLQLALNELLPEWGAYQCFGITSADYDESVSLDKLLNPATCTHFHFGPVQYSDHAVSPHEKLSCATRALYVIDGSDGPLVLFIRKEPYSYPRQIVVEIARNRSRAVILKNPRNRTLARAG